MQSDFYLKYEEWMPIDNYRYEVSSFGRVKSRVDRWGKERNIVLAGSIDKDGYHRVCLFINKKQYFKRTNILVAQYFLNNPEQKPQVNHIDGNKLNNHVDNLEWCDGSHNIRHSFRLGLHKGAKGEENVMAKINESIVTDIYNSTEPQERIALKYGVSQALVWKIKNRKIWGHILQKLTNEPGRFGKNNNGKLTQNQIVEIFLHKGKQKDIANEYGVVNSFVSGIKTGKYWSKLTSRL